MSERLVIVDHPMDCCLIVQAHGFNDLYGDWGAEPTHEGIQEALNELLQWQLDHRRNVAMVSLHQYQTIARDVVEANGFKKMMEVYNPNSSRSVAIYTKVLWETRDDYHTAVDHGYKTPTRNAWAETHEQGEKREEPLNAL